MHNDASNSICEKRRRARGSALVIGFAMVILLLAITMAFASRVTSNSMRSESDMAGERAYELAQSENTLRIQTVWSDFKSYAAEQRIAWLAGEDANLNGALDPGEDANHNGVLDPAHATDYQDADWSGSDTAASCTRIKILSMARNKWALVRFTTWARVADDMRGYSVIRKVQRVVRFSLKPASVFDFAYFATNCGTLDGSRAAIYGPVGANGDLILKDNPIIDGKIFAAKNPGLGALGQVTGTSLSDTLAQYHDKAVANALFPPTNPSAVPEDRNNNGILDDGEDLNNNGILDDFQFDLGYTGAPQILTNQHPAVLPTLGNLSIFKDYSASYVRPARADLGEAGGAFGGIVKQLSAPGLDPADPSNYRVLIDKTYGDNGEAGLRAEMAGNAVTYQTMTNKIETDPKNQWKNGNVALIGTPEQPLVIFGPVVVTNDLVIKGNITGQGTFFTGRNVHVVGDVTYVDPPQWKQDDTDLGNTIKVNKNKDAVGFGARGNIILGNYTDMSFGADMWNVAEKYFMPPFTQPSPVKNAADWKLGYAPPLATIANGDQDDGLSDQQDGKGRKNRPQKAPPAIFPGNYLVNDGGKLYLDDGSVPDQPNRAFYQSTFSSAYVNSVASKPKNMQGVYYAGHFMGGRADTLTLNGSLIAYDEGILSDNQATFIYDPRISPSNPISYINLFLPRNAAMDVVVWKDVSADDASAASPDW